MGKLGLSQVPRRGTIGNVRTWYPTWERRYLAYLIARSLAESTIGSRSPRCNSPCSAWHRGRENAHQETLDRVVSTAGSSGGRRTGAFSHDTGALRTRAGCIPVPDTRLECLLEVIGMEKQESAFGTGCRIDRPAREKAGDRVVWQP